MGKCLAQPEPRDHYPDQPREISHINRLGNGDSRRRLWQ